MTSLKTRKRMTRKLRLKSNSCHWFHGKTNKFLSLKLSRRYLYPDFCGFFRWTFATDFIADLILRSQQWQPNFGFGGFEGLVLSFSFPFPIPTKYSDGKNDYNHYGNNRNYYLQLFRFWFWIRVEWISGHWELSSTMPNPWRIFSHGSRNEWINEFAD